MAVTAGSMLGPYRIVGAIGAGGMGEVYRAHDPRLGRDVAIKVVAQAAAGDADRLWRFEQEARAAGALNHPNVLAVFDIGRDGDAPYVVSEFLDGATLHDRLRSGALPVRKAADYAIQVARGLAAAHDKGIVHRDLKPSNLFVTDDGHVKILDFGLAKLTRPESVDSGAATFTHDTEPGTSPGTVMGTVGYMSPEQVRGLPADHRSDIFSFGAVLYEMLAGRRAFQGETSVETMTAILKQEPPEIA
ncbi:MAG: serine/threonine protein kinase, partial [Actinobacteria bacterium]|nr:serine/threonine protein kinase [Actinomycetota bacterium]